jgi:leucyl aminopeptidase
MPVTISIDHAASLPVDVPDGALIAIGVRSGHLAEDAPGLDLDLASLAGFEGKAAQTLVAATTEGVRLLVGLGESPVAGDFRKIGAAAARAAAKQPALVADLLGPLEAAARPAAADVLAQGLLLGSYRYEQYQDTPDGVVLASATVVAKGGSRAADAVARGVAIGTAVCLGRDLVNTPGGALTPKVFAAKAVSEGEAVGLEVEVLDKAAIKKAKMGGLLGVNQGSTEEPRFVIMRYVPEGKPKGKVALVGKGLTFDAGGLSIKPPSSMETMKNDMGGGAAVVAAMTLVPLLAPKVQVTAYIPMTDNMLGGNAMRVGDVLTARNGTTMEVLNTDAEGRLILADALCLAVEDEPDAIIDAATLTGASMVALGDKMAGIMGNHEGLVDRVLAAAESQGEYAWHLPLPEHLRPLIDSDVADLRNIATKPFGGALTAGLFLQEFVEDVPWVHIDLAGPAFASAPWDETTKGGTGYGVRTIAGVLAAWSKLPAA